MIWKAAVWSARIAGAEMGLCGRHTWHFWRRCATSLPAPASRLFSFCLGEETLRAFGSLTERYLSTQLERGFSTLDFYKSLFPVRDA